MNILKKLNATTGQTIMYVGLAVGLGGGVFAAAHHTTTHAPITVKSVSDTQPATTGDSAPTDTPTSPASPASTTTTGTTSSSSQSTTPSTPATDPVTDTTPPDVTVLTSVFQGADGSGMCEQTYSDGTSGEVRAVVTTQVVGYKVVIYHNNCDSLVGQVKQ